MSIVLVVFLCGLAIIVAGFYAGLETAAYSASRLRLRYLSERGDSRALAALALMGDMQGLVTVTLIGHNIAVYCGTWVLQNYLHGRGVFAAEFWATALLTPFCFIFSETTPKQLGHALSEQYCLFGARAVRVSSLVFRPLAFLLGLVSKIMSLLLKAAGLGRVSYSAREKVIAHLDIGTREGAFSNGQMAMANSIMSIERRSVSGLITLFTDVASVKKTTSCAEVIAVMRSSGITWVPVVDKRREVVYGIIKTKDILKTPEADNLKAEDLMRPPVLIDSGQSVSGALLKLQRRYSKIGVVAEGERAVGYLSLSRLVDEALGRVE